MEIAQYFHNNTKQNNKMYYIKLKTADLQVFSFKAVFMFSLFQFVFIVFLDLYYRSKNSRQMKNTQVKKQQQKSFFLKYCHFILKIKNRNIEFSSGRIHV